jgi:FtsH-binding integral membrane protein
MRKVFTQKISQIFLALMFALALVVPQVTFAESCDELKQRITNSGYKVEGVLPEYCNVQSLYNKFISIALYAIGIVSVVAIIYGGFLYMTAAGKEEQAKKGRQVLTWAIIGLIVVITASIIINIVAKGLVEKWFV